MKAKIKKTVNEADFISQRRTEIPKLINYLVACAKAGDKEAQHTLQMLGDASMGGIFKLTDDDNVEATIHLIGSLM